MKNKYYNKLLSFVPALFALALVALPFHQAKAANISATWTVAAWSTGYTANLVIKNNGSTAINGWTATFQTPQQATSCWNATMTGPAGNVYTLTDAGWNATIPPNGGTVSVGFTFNGAPPYTPINFTVNGQSVVLNGPGSGGGNPTPTPTATPVPTATPKPSATPTATPKSSATPTATPKPSATPTATPKPSATPTASPSASPTASPTASPSASPTATPGSVVTSGTINYHYDFEAGSTTGEDSIVLAGDNYTDLIMSNLIAGVMYGHLIQEMNPGIQFNEDYIYGSMFGQLLQENGSGYVETYLSSGSNINQQAYQQGVMGPNEGGPYQINSYLADFVGGSTTPVGFSLVNFAALQKNIGYTIAGAPAQYSLNMPASFNNKYYGPMMCAFIQALDFLSLQFIGGSSLTEPWTATNHGYDPEWQPYYSEALASFMGLPGNQLDVILNVGYNAGTYNNLFLSKVEASAPSTEATVTAFNSYSNAAGGDSYHQYPYQVRSYLDQLFDKPSQSPVDLSTVAFKNHVAFNMSTLEGVFSNVFQMLAYVDGSGNYVSFTAEEAATAFESALSTSGLTDSSTLDLSDANDRAVIFTVINNAISNLEKDENTNFSTRTTTQL